MAEPLAMALAYWFVSGSGKSVATFKSQDIYGYCYFNMFMCIIYTYYVDYLIKYAIFS